VQLLRHVGARDGHEDERHTEFPGQRVRHLDVETYQVASAVEIGKW
jgi:hypothetical protein